MRGKEEVEWQDRAWRILNNKGEMQTDWVTAGGVGAGAVVGVAAARRGALPLSTANAILGGAGAGSAIGMKPKSNNHIRIRHGHETDKSQAYHS